jgi:hypothetical protein
MINSYLLIGKVMPHSSLIFQLVTAVEEENEGGRMMQETRRVGKIPL